jgi:hypothetical protein
MATGEILRTDRAARACHDEPDDDPDNRPHPTPSQPDRGPSGM